MAGQYKLGDGTVVIDEDGNLILKENAKLYVSGDLSANTTDPSIGDIDFSSRSSQVSSLFSASIPNPPYYGTSAGFANRDGALASFPNNNQQLIKFPFASDTSITNVGRFSALLNQGDPAGFGTVTTVPAHRGSLSSGTNGYTIAFVRTGAHTANTSEDVPSTFKNITKFPFSISDAEIFGVANLDDYTAQGVLAASSPNAGYTAGGQYMSGNEIFDRHVIDRFPFSADVDATVVGDITSPLTIAYSNRTIHADNYNMYFVSGTIDRFPFASEGVSTIVAINDLTSSPFGFTTPSFFDVGSGFNQTGWSTPSEAFITFGSFKLRSQIDNIVKFPFASVSDAVEVAELIGTPTIEWKYAYPGATPSIPYSPSVPFPDLFYGTITENMASISSSTKGYGLGGDLQSDNFPPYSGYGTREMRSFPFSITSGISTLVGNLPGTALPVLPSPAPPDHTQFAPSGFASGSNFTPYFFSGTQS